MRVRRLLESLSRLIEAGQSDIPGLPPKVADAFLELGYEQRGWAEEAMESAQEALGGGRFSSVIEHVGDLTNRMTVAAPRGRAGFDTVKSKIEFARSYNPTTFGDEIDSVAASTANYRKIPLADYWAKAKPLLAAYSAAHASLKVYNEAQWHAREAAVELGKMNWRAVFKHLEALHEHLTTVEKWVTYAHAFQVDAGGAPIEYRA